MLVPVYHAAEQAVAPDASTALFSSSLIAPLIKCLCSAQVNSRVGWFRLVYELQT